MKLNDILAPYKYFSRSTPEDNQGILEFFNSITMDTKTFSLRYDRGNDFFLFAKEQSDKNFIFVMRDEKGKILGTAAIATIPHYVNGKLELLGYLGDLRISPLLSPKIRINWKKCYSDIIVNFSKIEEFQGIKYLYSAILDENQNAMRSLLKNNDQIIYHELTEYESINIFLPKLISHKPSNFKIESTNIAELRAFLEIANRRPGMSDYFYLEENTNQVDELQRRLNSWSNFSVDSFLVVRNQKNKIIACCAPWICQSKKLVIEKMSLSQKIIGKLVPLIGIPEIKEGKPIKTLYLTHLNFDRELSAELKKEIITQIVQKLFKERKTEFHLVSFLTYPQWSLDDIPFYYQRTKAKFYQVMSKDEFDAKEFLDLQNLPPAFEIGIA